MAELPTPDNLARLPAELQRQVGRYLLKEEPAKCVIEEILDSRHGNIIEYWITRNGKLKCVYTVPEFYFGCLKFEGLEAFLALKGCPAGRDGTSVEVYFEEYFEEPKLTFSLSAETIEDEEFVVLRALGNFPAPGTTFKYCFFKAAFDHMLRDLAGRNKKE